MAKRPTPVISPPAGESVTQLEYHHGSVWGPLLSSHRFFAFYESPACFRWPLPDKSVSDGLRLGQLFALVIEHFSEHDDIGYEDLKDKLFVLPPLGFQTSSDRNRWVDIQASLGIENPGRLKAEILTNIARQTERLGLMCCTREELDHAIDEAKSIYLNPNAHALCAGADRERSYRAHGCRARPDLLNSNVMPDFKRSAISDPRRWRYNAFDLGYHRQAAWYERVLGLCGRTVDTWCWIVLDPKPYRLDSRDRPVHKVNVFVAEQGLRERALNDLENALHQYYQCVKSGDWPDVHAPIHTLYDINEDSL